MTNSKRAAGLLAALIAAYVLTGVMMLLLALGMYKFGWKTRTVEFAITFLYIAASALAGFLAGGCMQTKKYLWGCLAGFLYVMILFVVSVLVNKGFASLEDNGLSTFLLCLGGGMLGGMIR